MELRGARYLHILVPVPARLGHRASSDTIKIARLATRDRPLPGLRGRATARSPASRRSAARCRSRSTCKLQRRYAHLFEPEPRAGHHRADPGARRPQHRALRPARRRRGRDGQAVRDHARRRLEPGQQDRQLAHRAPGLRATGCRRATTPARPARTSRSGSTTPRRADYETRLAQHHGGQPVPGRSWAGSATTPARPPATAASSTRRSASTRSSASSATRRSSRAGQSRSPRRRSGKRVLVVGAGPSGLSAAYHLARLGHEVTIRDAGPAPGGMMRFGIPKYRLPRDVLDAEIAADPRHGRRARARTPTSTDVAEAMREGGFDAVFLAVGAHIGKRAYIPAGDRPRRSSTRSRCCAAWRARSSRCSAGASSSTAAATPRWTPPAPPSGSAPTDAVVVYRRTRERMPAHDFEVEEALRGGRRRCKWLSTIKHADDGKRRGREDGARRDRLPAADRRVRGAGGRLGRPRARPGGRPVAARRRRRASRSRTASCRSGRT